MTITTTDRRLRVTDDLCHTDNSYQGNRLPRDWTGRTIRWTEGDYTIRCTTSGTSAWMVTEELLEQLEERFRAETEGGQGATAEPQAEPQATPQAFPLEVGSQVVLVQDARRAYGTPVRYYDYRDGTERALRQGDTATVVRPRDGDGEVMLRIERGVGGPTNVYVDADCVRRIDDPTAGDVAEVARLTRELEQVKEQHERAMKELGVKAQLLGKETGMCGVLEKFAEEYGIPFDGIPFSGTITVTYKVEGTIDRDYAEAETIEEAIRVDEDGVHADLPENYSRSGHSDLHTIEVEEVDFDLTVGG